MIETASAPKVAAAELRSIAVVQFSGDAVDAGVVFAPLAWLISMPRLLTVAFSGPPPANVPFWMLAVIAVQLRVSPVATAGFSVAIASGAGGDREADALVRRADEQARLEAVARVAVVAEDVQRERRQLGVVEVDAAGRVECRRRRR